MSAMERIYKIDSLLASRKAISSAELMDRLQVSLPTLKRDIGYMRDRLNAPIIYDRQLGGYRFDHQPSPTGPAYELPGLWFSAAEIHALLTMQHLLANLDTGGLLGPQIHPLQSRLKALLGTAHNAADDVIQRVRILSMGARDYSPEHFQTIGSALLRRKRLTIRYYSRSTGATTTREISPQRLIHYRDNWYLDAWCHLRHDLRSFAVDAIEQAAEQDQPAEEIDPPELDKKLAAGYGIFAGENIQWATLLFSAERARWVAREHWHPQQTGQYLPDGRYQLRLPYSNDPELIMDILKYGQACTVLEPPGLVERIAEERQRTTHRGG